MPTYTTNSATDGLPILPDGDYDFSVSEAREKVSSSGNPMIELTLRIKSKGAPPVRVFDNLVFTPNAFWRIDAFRIATGETVPAGQKVNFEAEDCLDRSGRCILYSDSYNGKVRNKVAEYLAPDKSQPVDKARTAKAAPSPKAMVGAPSQLDEEPDHIFF
jgi:hypothetical protein